MKTQWKKVLGDFRVHRVQIVFIGLVLLLGSAGVLATLNARATLQREIARSFEAARTPDLTIGLDAVEPPLLELARAHPDVAGADARRVLTSRAASGRSEWFTMRLIVVRDFTDQRVGVVHRHGGGWERAQEGIYLEQSSLVLLNLGPDEPLRVRAPGGETLAIPVAGVVHDTGVAPGFQERLVYAYVSPTVAARLGQNAVLDQLAIRLKERHTATHVLGELREQLGAKGATARRIEMVPRTHPHAMLMATMLRVLGFLAGMAFVCSSALAGYVVSLWMKREVRQVGIMKSIGATSGLLARQYLALVAPLVLVANALALPLGGWLGEFLIRYNEVNLNIDVFERGTPLLRLLGQATLATLIPLAAMALPILRAARQTAREAMQDPGITAQSVSAARWRTRLTVGGSREWTFALRNLLRRPWRLVITLTALTVGGGLWLVAKFAFASLMGVVDSSLAHQAYDLQVSLRRPMEVGDLRRVVAGWTKCEVAEVWRRGSIAYGGGWVTPEMALPQGGLAVAYPNDSRLQTLPATVGRWPRPDEVDAVCISRVARVALGVKVGDSVVIEPLNRPRAPMRVVGEFEEFGGPAFYLPFSGGEKLFGPMERGSYVVAKAREGQIAAAADQIDLGCIDARIDLASIDSRAARRAGMEEHFLGVVGICGLVSTAAALFGMISLLAFGCLNVLERVREIGVIRALGATPGKVALLFVAESAVAVALSTVLALGLGVGVTRYLNHLMSTRALQITIPLQIDPAAIGVVALGVLVVLVAVWLTVSRLVRSTVRETLAYE